MTCGEGGSRARRERWGEGVEGSRAEHVRSVTCINFLFFLILFPCLCFLPLFCEVRLGSVFAMFPERLRKTLRVKSGRLFSPLDSCCRPSP